MLYSPTAKGPGAGAGIDRPARQMREGEHAGQVDQDCDDREGGQRGKHAELAVKKIDHSGVTGNVGPSEEIRVS